MIKIDVKKSKRQIFEDGVSTLPDQQRPLRLYQPATTETSEWLQTLLASSLV
jgi:hypothetical protein